MDVLGCTVVQLMTGGGDTVIGNWGGDRAITSWGGDDVADMGGGDSVAIAGRRVLIPDPMRRSVAGAIGLETRERSETTTVPKQTKIQ